jgi:hypothetical protein
LERAELWTIVGTPNGRLRYRTCSTHGFAKRHAAMGQRLRKKKKKKSRVSSTWANIDACIPTVQRRKRPKKGAAKTIMLPKKKKKKKKKKQTIPRGVGIHIHVRFIACYWSLLKKIKNKVRATVTSISWPNNPRFRVLYLRKLVRFQFSPLVCFHFVAKAGRNVGRAVKRLYHKAAKKNLASSATASPLFFSTLTSR